MTARNVADRERTNRRLLAIVLAMFAFVASAASAAAETLLMPKRDFLMGANEVIWGVTDQANGTAMTINFGDGTANLVTTVTDRSFIATNHIYAGSGVFTITLTVGAEVTTVDVNVYNSALLTPEVLRNLNINRAIHNALRYVWTSQVNRTTNFPAGIETNWGGFGSFTGAYASLIVLAVQNHGFRLDGNNPPTGIFEKYVVRRGLNHILNVLQQFQATAEPAGDPCVGGFGPAPCTALRLNQDSGHSAYETGLAALPFAASGAPNRIVGEIAGTGSGGFVVGKTYGEILQRLVIALSWGQNENGSGRGGWGYVLDNQAASDGSTVGWVLLALLDATAAGATVPAFVKAEWSNPLPNGALANGLNNDGSFDYQSDSTPTSNNSVNVAKAGVGIQGMFFAGRPNGDAGLTAALNYVNARWNGPISESFQCSGGVTNKGCGYGMFNVFKGLKLYGVTTLSNVNRAAPIGGFGEDDWHADYQDWLVTNQTNPLVTTGGNWTPLHFSSQVSGFEAAEAAEGLLILAPVALVLPDPGLFSTVGLSPQTDTNPVGSSHTVTATALAANKAPVPTATVNFQVLTGPNAGKTGTGVTDNNGQTTFTYTDTGPAAGGTDTIQAFIGNLGSNVVTKIWVAAGGVRCDTDNDKDVDITDLNNIRAANGLLASSPTDPRDGNGDGRINVADLRYCQLRLGALPQ